MLMYFETMHASYTLTLACVDHQMLYHAYIISICITHVPVTRNHASCLQALTPVCC